MLIVLKSCQVPSSSDIDNFGVTKNIMLDLLIQQAFGSEDEDEKFFDHHGKNAARIESEHNFEESLKVFVVFDTIKNLVAVERDGRVDQFSNFGFINGELFAFGQFTDHLGQVLG